MSSLQRIIVLIIFSSLLIPPAVTVEAEEPNAQGIRAVVPKADTKVTVDGDLAEFANALCTPVEYFHPDIANRPAQFYYMWDDDAFYAGLKSLDERTFTPVTPLWEGDAVEWYFDTRRGHDFLSDAWPKGRSDAVHCFFTGLNLDKLEPRFCLRPGYEDAIPKIGVETAARRTEHGLEVEFKLPWENFPGFKPRVGEVIGLDAELSYSDGISRSYRSFVFGGPLSVDHPSNLAKVQLVEKLEPEHWKICGPVMMPIRVDVPWRQEGELKVLGKIAVPPNREDEVGSVVFELVNLHGQALEEFETLDKQTIQPDGNFAVYVASWPWRDFAPGNYHVQAIVYDKQGAELARIAPRLTSVNLEQGY